jgi:hypothetical protein
MMTSTGHKENYISLVKDGSNDGNIRQMRSTCQLRMVGDQDIALLNAFPTFGIPIFDLKSHGRLHGTQMHGNVWRIGDQSTILGKECTREIQSFLHERN